MLRLGKDDEKEDLAEVIAYALEEIGKGKHELSYLADKIADSVLANGYRRSGIIPSNDWDLLMYYYQCSLCGVYLSKQANFCPHCGAKMKGE